MKIRLRNVKIETMEEGKPVFLGELRTNGNQITYVGPEKEDGEPFDRTIDGKGNLILPGFKNAHTHSPMTFLRSYADDLPLLDWLNQQVFPMEAQLRKKDIGPLTKLAILEYLTSGITACFDMYLFPKEAAQAAVESGFRMVLCGSVNDFTSSPEELSEDHKTFNHFDPLITHQLGFHAEYTTAPERMKKIAKLAHEFEAPVYVHNSESVSEVEQCKERTGMTPTAFMDSLHLFDFGGGGFHCVHMTPEDLDICVKRGISVITNPASNAKLASGIAPLCEMEKRKINLAIGTDGPASNNCLDMFREMFLTTALQKLSLNDASAMDANTVLRMATVGGAKAMRLSNCETLSPGQQADLIMIDLHQPNMQPENNLLKNLVYSGSKQNVKMTMVAGKILYEDGKFSIGEDPEEIYREANEIIAEKKEMAEQAAKNK